MRSRLYPLFSGFVILVSATAAVRADELAWQVASGCSSKSNDGLIGTEFTPTADIVVTALGYYDDTAASGDGLSAPHPVAIYEVATRKLVVSETVPAGTEAEKVNRFRFVPVRATPLKAGTIYVVVGVATGDPGQNASPDSPLMVDSSIRLGHWRSGSGTELAFPDTATPGAPTRFMGPTFTFVPEPGTLAGLLLGSMFLLPRRRRRR